MSISTFEPAGKLVAANSKRGFRSPLHDWRKHHAGVVPSADLQPIEPGVAGLIHRVVKLDAIVAVGRSGERQPGIAAECGRALGPSQRHAARIVDMNHRIERTAQTPGLDFDDELLIFLECDDVFAV